MPERSAAVRELQAVVVPPNISGLEKSYQLERLRRIRLADRISARDNGWPESLSLKNLRR